MWDEATASVCVCVCIRLLSCFLFFLFCPFFPYTSSCPSWMIPALSHSTVQFIATQLDSNGPWWRPECVTVAAFLAITDFSGSLWIPYNNLLNPGVLANTPYRAWILISPWELSHKWVSCSLVPRQSRAQCFLDCYMTFELCELSQAQFKGHVCSQESGVGDLPGNKASNSCTLLLII